MATAAVVSALLIWQSGSKAQSTGSPAVGSSTVSGLVVEPATSALPGSDGPALFAPAATASFSGISDTGAFPPSPSIAVGPNHIIQVVNGAYRMSNKTGTQLEAGSFSSFPWASVDQTGTKVSFNPKVIYDHFADRWAMLALNRDTTTGVSNYLLAASITADPTGSWCAVAVRADINGSTASGNWANHAQLGFDNTNFYITSDQFSFATGAFAYGKLRVMAKSQFAACGTFTWADFTNISGAPAGLAPARTFGTPGVGYIMNAAPAGGSTLSIRTVTGTWPNPSSIVPVLSAAVSVSVQPYTAPTDAPSSGSTTPVDTGDARLLNVVYRNGFLFAAHTVGSSCPDAATPSCARYYQITPGASPSVSIQESVGSAGLYYFYPAVEPDPSNNIFMVFGRTRASQFIESAYTVRKTTDSAMQASNPLQIGSSSYTRNDSAGVNRWGPYGGAAVDPSDGTVWVTHAAAGSTQNTWVTRVAKLSLNLPGPFGKTFPVDGAVEQNIYPTELSWGASSGTGSYAYCVDTTDDNECDDDLWMYVGPFISASFTGLSPDTTYYWHVKKTNSNGDTYADGGSSAWWSFRTITPPSPFSKIGPADTATGVSTSPTLSWGAATKFIRYDYCLQQTRNNNVCSQWIQAGTNTSKALTGLLAGTTYYWQVRALGLGGTTYADGNGSALWSFTTQPTGPGAFAKTGPTNGLTGHTTSPTLSWGTSAGAMDYEYCIDKTNDNACAGWASVGTNSQVSLTNLTAATYYWHVRATNIDGTTYADGNATAFHNFTTAGPPNDSFVNATVIGASPHETIQDTSEATTGPEDPGVPCGNDNRSRSVWFVYTPAVTGLVNINTVGSTYDTILTVYTGSPGSFVPLGCNDDTVGLTSNLNVQGTAGQPLAILVTSFNPASDELWLHVTDFPGPFGKVGPANGAVGQASSVTLSWGGSSGTGAYYYCITPNDNGCFDWVSASSNNSVGLNNLTAGTTYYWQVRIQHPGGLTYADGSHSAIWTFTTDGPAFGQVDTPSQNANGVQGAIGVTGWALDDVGVDRVDIYRNCLPFEPGNCQTILGQSLVYVGQAAFLTGARPDVAAAFPTHPNNNRAGWGYLMLTPMLPHVPNSQPYGGEGTLTLYAIATDAAGQRTLLGRSSDPLSPDHSMPTTITMANDTIAKPFGAIDSPAQGETISGIFNNFGWALTPDTNTTAGDPGDIVIPKTGSAITVFIDALPVALVAYNQCRGTVGNPVPFGSFCNDDVANIFGNPTPQLPLAPRFSNPTLFRNLDAASAAIGAFTFNTSTLTNGLHTIAWSVTDSHGRNEGIGSRFFVVSNPAPAVADEHIDELPIRATASAPVAAASTFPLTSTAQLPPATPASEGVWWRTGFDLAARWERLPASGAGTFDVQLAELGRLELWLGEPVEAGYLVANEALQPLPVGAAVSGARFGWMPPAGYTGPYHFVFLRNGERIDVTVIVVEKGR